MERDGRGSVGRISQKPVFTSECLRDWFARSSRDGVIDAGEIREGHALVMNNVDACQEADDRIAVAAHFLRAANDPRHTEGLLSRLGINVARITRRRFAA